MPGIVTHHRIMHEMIEFLPKKKYRNFLTRMLIVRFSDPRFRNAALFGTTGPDIFDYIPCNRENVFKGSRISFLLHGRGGRDVVTVMARSLKDNNNRETSLYNLQRAYLYGYLAHVVSDAFFHPYVYYWAGFPSNGNNSEKRFYREQYLLHQYNIDQYFEYYYETDNYLFRLEDLLPPVSGAEKEEMMRSAKALLLGAIKEIYPVQYKKLIWKMGSEDKNPVADSRGVMDIVPGAMRTVYRLKQSRRPWIVKLLKNIRRNLPWYSDFIVQYPDPRRVNKHLLNLHRERWFYPAGDGGLHHESVEDLLKKCRDGVIEYLERLEHYLMPDVKESFASIVGEIPDGYTGNPESSFEDMKQMNPHRIRY